MAARGRMLGGVLLALVLVVSSMGGVAGTAAAAVQIETGKSDGAVGLVQTRGGSERAVVQPAASAFNVLQMNLCNSGANDDCFRHGLAVKDAVNLIKFLRPNVVTLNEVCENDVHNDLYTAFRQAWQNTPRHVTFALSVYIMEPGGDDYKLCENDQRYVVGILGHVPGDEFVDLAVGGDTYPATLQHPDDNEWRAWGCVAAVGVYYACTTHLTSHGGQIAMNQCEELMDTIVPTWAWVNGAALPTVVGGDLNLTYRGDPDVQDCVPSGWFRKGDGNLQHIMATNDLTFLNSHRIEMCQDGRTPRCSTDHPAWLVGLNRP